MIATFSNTNGTTQYQHGTIIRAGITCKKIAIRYKQKKQKYFSLADHQLAENLILVFGQKRDKSKLVTTFLGIIVTIIII